MQNQETTDLNMAIPGITTEPVLPTDVAADELKRIAKTTAVVLGTTMAALTPTASTVSTTVSAGALAASTMSCEKDEVKPVEDLNKLTPEQQAFVELLKPHPDGTLKYAILEGGVEPYVFKNFAKVTLELLNAKSMSYTATPIIQKKSVEEVIAKAKELNPGQPLYLITLSLVKKSASGEIVLNATEEIVDKDDNNPSTPAPWLDLLPDEFTLDIFQKFSPNSKTPKSYTLNSGEELLVRMAVTGGSNAGATFSSNFKFGLDPVKKVN
jgi:hypothetical protein